MDPLQCSTVWDCLQRIPDPRHPRGVRYPWLELLGILALGLSQGLTHVSAIADWAQAHAREMCEALPHHRASMPSYSTLIRALRLIDPSLLEALIRLHGEHLASAPSPSSPPCGLALDGKALRGTQAHGQPGYLVSLMEHDSGIVRAQCSVPLHGREEAVAGGLLAGVGLCGTCLTADAAFTHRALATQVVAQGGDYLMVVKGNQPTLLTALEQFFEAPPWPRRLEDRRHHSARGHAHGRSERRSLVVADAFDTLAWPGLRQVLQRSCRRRVRDRVQENVTYAITSLDASRADPAALARLWRGHWSIENRLHYVRDTALGEDRCQLHTGNAPEALAGLRTLLLNALRASGWGNIAQALRHHAGSMQDSLQLLGLS